MKQAKQQNFAPGLILLFGSGETSPSGRKAFDVGFRHIPGGFRPEVSPKVALLETPSGYELNSSQVVGRVGDYLREHLQNYHPETIVIPARKRGTSLSPDNPEIVAPLFHADMIFMGPGSPTYMVRQLSGSLAWHALVARHRLGAVLALASAASVAISQYALPVYEIYKVGEDIHWKSGLDFFRSYGLSLVFIPHWNNNDGGEELDTSRCFMGRARFDPLMEMLPAGCRVVGLDEKTILAMDLSKHTGRVIGQGAVTILCQESEARYKRGQEFDLSELGDFRVPDPKEGLPNDVWEQALKAQQTAGPLPERTDVGEPSAMVLSLVEQRQEARARQDWLAADQLRQEIAGLGWQVEDTPEGPRLAKQTK